MSMYLSVTTVNSSLCASSKRLLGRPRSPRHFAPSQKACRKRITSAFEGMRCCMPGTLGMPSLVQVHVPAAAHLQPPGKGCARAHGLPRYLGSWFLAGTSGGRLEAHLARTRLGLLTRGHMSVHALVHHARIGTALALWEVRACASAQRQAQRSMQPRHTWLHFSVAHVLPRARLCDQLGSPMCFQSNLAVQHLKTHWVCSPHGGPNDHG